MVQIRQNLTASIMLEKRMMYILGYASRRIDMYIIYIVTSEIVVCLVISWQNEKDDLHISD